MKRDMGIIRQILLEMERRPYGRSWQSPAVEGCELATLMGHIELAAEAGLIHISDRTYMGAQHRMYEVNRLTWDGHEFLNASRDPGTWEKFQDAAGRLGGVTMPIAMALLTEFAKAKARDYGFLPPP